MKKVLDGRIYQMTVTLKGIRPPIWRRVQVPGTLSLAAFHDMIQTVFGWTDSHLHQFHIGGVSYGQLDDFDEAIEDESGVTLAKALGSPDQAFLIRLRFRRQLGARGSRREDCCGQLGWRAAIVPRGQAAPAAGGLRRCARLSKFS